VKFQIQIQENYVDEWKSKYIKYYNLKGKLHELKTLLQQTSNNIQTFSTVNQSVNPYQSNKEYKPFAEEPEGTQPLEEPDTNQENQDKDQPVRNSLTNPDIYSNNREGLIQQINHKSDNCSSEELLESLYKVLPQGSTLQEFLSQISSQIRQLFTFYIEFERKIYISVNKKLNKQSKHAFFSLEDIYLEMKKLGAVIETLTNFVYFIRINFIAIKKIISKFDLFVSEFYGDVTLIYLRSILEKPTSDLNYMFRCKIIYEVMVLINYLKNELTNQALIKHTGSSMLSQGEESMMPTFVSPTNQATNRPSQIEEESKEGDNKDKDNNDTELNKKRSILDINRVTFKSSIEGKKDDPLKRSLSAVRTQGRLSKGNTQISREGINDPDQEDLFVNKENIQVDDNEDIQTADRIKNMKHTIEAYMEDLDYLTSEIREIIGDWKIIAQEESEGLTAPEDLNQIRYQTLPNEMDFFRRLISKRNKPKSEKMSLYSSNNARLRKISVSEDGKVVFVQDHHSSRKESLSLKLPKDRLNDIEVFSRQNKINIILCMIHTFAYMFIYTSATPTNSKYLKKMGLDESMTGVVLAATPLAAIFSTIACSPWSNYNYKYPLSISAFCFVIGNFLYGFAYDFESFIMVFIGRFLIGIGCGKIVCRRYLIDHVPKSLSTVFSVYYSLVTSLGLAVGPLTSIFMSMASDSNVGKIYINEFTLPGWVCFIFSLLLFLGFVFFFTEPINNPKFSAYIPEYYHSHLNKTTNKSRKPSLSTDNTLNTNTNTLKDRLLKAGIVERKASSESENNSKTLLDLNNKLDLINKKFTTTDMFREKIKAEKNDHIFSEIKGSFMLLSFALVITRIFVESLVVSAPVFLGYLRKDTTFIEVFLSIGTFSLIPVGFGFKYLIVHLDERKAYLWIALFCIFGSLGLSYIINDSLVQYSVFFLIGINVGYTFDTIASSLFIQTYIEDLEATSYNSGFIISYSTTVGRTIGPLMVTMIVVIFGDKWLMTSLYGLCTVLYAGIALVTLIYRKELRVKAITKLNN